MLPPHFSDLLRTRVLAFAISLYFDQSLTGAAFCIFTAACAGPCEYAHWCVYAGRAAAVRRDGACHGRCPSHQALDVHRYFAAQVASDVKRATCSRSLSISESDKSLILLEKPMPAAVQIRARISCARCQKSRVSAISAMLMIWNVYATNPAMC